MAEINHRRYRRRVCVTPTFAKVEASIMVFENLWEFECFSSLFFSPVTSIFTVSCIKRHTIRAIRSVKHTLTFSKKEKNKNAVYMNCSICEDGKSIKNVNAEMRKLKIVYQYNTSSLEKHFLIAWCHVPPFFLHLFCCSAAFIFISFAWNQNCVRYLVTFSFSFVVQRLLLFLRKNLAYSTTTKERRKEIRYV